MPANCELCPLAPLWQQSLGEGLEAGPIPRARGFFITALSTMTLTEQRPRALRAGTSHNLFPFLSICPAQNLAYSQ